jgi:hypothetical protein
MYTRLLRELFARVQDILIVALALLCAGGADSSSRGRSFSSRRGCCKEATHTLQLRGTQLQGLAEGLMRASWTRKGILCFVQYM